MLVKAINPALASSNGVNTDHVKSGPNQDAIVRKLATKAGEGRTWVLDAIQYSYSTFDGATALGAPIKGGITIKDGDKIKWDADVPDLTGVLNLYIPASPGKDLEILLKAGGINIVGKLNVQTHIEGE